MRECSQLWRHPGGHLIGDLAGFIGDVRTVRLDVDDHMWHRAQYVLTDPAAGDCLHVPLTILGGVPLGSAKVHGVA
jgi:hypothetical protein